MLAQTNLISLIVIYLQPPSPCALNFWHVPTCLDLVILIFHTSQLLVKQPPYFHFPRRAFPLLDYPMFLVFAHFSLCSISTHPQSCQFPANFLHRLGLFSTSLCRLASKVINTKSLNRHFSYLCFFNSVWLVLPPTSENIEWKRGLVGTGVQQGLRTAGGKPHRLAAGRGRERGPRHRQ